MTLILGKPPGGWLLWSLLSSHAVLRRSRHTRRQRPLSATIAGGCALFSCDGVNRRARRRLGGPPGAVPAVLPSRDAATPATVAPFRRPMSPVQTLGVVRPSDAICVPKVPSGRESLSARRSCVPKVAIRHASHAAGRAVLARTAPELDCLSPSVRGRSTCRTRCGRTARPSRHMREMWSPRQQTGGVSRSRILFVQVSGFREHATTKSRAGGDTGSSPLEAEPPGQRREALVILGPLCRHRLVASPNARSAAWATSCGLPEASITAPGSSGASGSSRASWLGSRDAGRK